MTASSCAFVSVRAVTCVRVLCMPASTLSCGCPTCKASGVFPPAVAHCSKAVRLVGHCVRTFFLLQYLPPSLHPSTHLFPKHSSSCFSSFITLSCLHLLYISVSCLFIFWHHHSDIECIYMCISILVLNLILVPGIYTEHEKPGYSYPCIHDHNNILICDCLPWQCGLISQHRRHYEMVQKPRIRRLHATVSCFYPRLQIQVSETGLSCYTCQKHNQDTTVHENALVVLCVLFSAFNLFACWLI